MRLDLYLTQQQYFDSRNKAAASVKEGCFAVNGKVILKPAYNIEENDCIERVRGGSEYVARSAHKLLKAFRSFNLEWEGRTVADLGASTGGFCQVLLEHGVQKIYAVDIGTAQLHEKVKKDPRVINLEHTNARFLTDKSFPEPIDAITADLSFISIKTVLPAIFQTLKPDGECIILVKPQFECGPQFLSKSGVVTNRKVQLRVLEEVANFASNLGFFVHGIIFSGLAGESGNREYLLYIKNKEVSTLSIPSAAKKAVYSEESYE